MKIKHKMYRVKMTGVAITDDGVELKTAETSGPALNETMAKGVALAMASKDKFLVLHATVAEAPDLQVREGLDKEVEDKIAQLSKEKGYTEEQILEEMKKGPAGGIFGAQKQEKAQEKADKLFDKYHLGN